MSEERYVKQIVSDVMEMAAKIKFLEAKVAASESWNAECVADHDAALRRAKAEGVREAAKQLPTTWLDPALGALGKGPWNCPEIERFVHRLRTDLDARAAQIEEGE